MARACDCAGSFAGDGGLSVSKRMRCLRNLRNWVRAGRILADNADFRECLFRPLLALPRRGDAARRCVAGLAACAGKRIIIFAKQFLAELAGGSVRQEKSQFAWAEISNDNQNSHHGRGGTRFPQFQRRLSR